MTIIHIELFEFVDGVSGDVVEDVCRRMLNLSNECRHPDNGQQYVMNGHGGRNRSVGASSGGITHAFISQFVTAEDLKYYLEADPVHAAFVRSLAGVVKRAQVVDFEENVF